MKRLLSVLLTILMVLTLVPFSLSAEETSDFVEIKQSFIEIGVDPKKANELTAKVMKGELLDSMKNEYDYILPTRTIDFEQGIIEDVYEYPDGSIKKVSLIIGPEVLTGTITGGTYQSGSYYYSWKNAKVLATWAVVTASFYATFEGTPTSGKIYDVWDEGIIVAGGTFSNESLTIVRSEATQSDEALAQLKFTGSVVGGFGQATFYLRLHVPYGTAPSASFSVLN